MAAGAEGYFILGPGLVYGELDWRRRPDPSNTQGFGITGVPMVVYNKTASGGGGGDVSLLIEDGTCLYKPDDGIFSTIGLNWILLGSMRAEYRGGRGCLPLGEQMFDVAWPDGQGPVATFIDTDGSRYYWGGSTENVSVPRVRAFVGKMTREQINSAFSIALSEEGCFGQAYVSTSASELTWTLPRISNVVPREFAQCSFYANAAGEICIDPNAVDTILFPGQSMGLGDRICSTQGSGSCVTLKPVSSTEWGILSGCYDWENGG